MNTILIQRKLHDDSIQHLNVEVEKVKLTKSFLNKAIAWSSSRYEVWKKKQVVDHIFKAMNENGYKQKRFNVLNELYEITLTSDYFHSGSYCECSSMTRKGSYYIDYVKKILIDCEVSDYTGEIGKIYKAYQFC